MTQDNENLSPARMLAPVALGVAVITIVIVIAGSLGDGDRSATAPAERTGPQTEQPQRKVPKTYTVQPGDTLSQIAESTGVPEETIERLNKGLDPVTLNAGQVLKLRP